MIDPADLEKILHEKAHDYELNMLAADDRGEWKAAIAYGACALVLEEISQLVSEWEHREAA